MKLSTKIAMGFALTNLIFIALVVAVFLFMRPVQHGAADLSNNVLPMLNQPSNLQYNAAMEGSEMRNFLLTTSEDAWSRATEYSEGVRKALDDLDKNLKAPNSESITTPDVLETFQSLRTDYAQYRNLADDVKLWSSRKR